MYSNAWGIGVGSFERSGARTLSPPGAALQRNQPEMRWPLCERLVILSVTRCGSVPIGSVGALKRADPREGGMDGSEKQQSSRILAAEVADQAHVSPQQGRRNRRVRRVLFQAT